MVIKEAEQGPLTEGRRQRVRAAAAVAQAQSTSGPSPLPLTSPVATQGLSPIFHSEHAGSWTASLLCSHEVSWACSCILDGHSFLIFANRRMDRSFTLPSGSISTSGFLRVSKNWISKAVTAAISCRSQVQILTTHLAPVNPPLLPLPNYFRVCRRSMSYSALSNSSLSLEALGMITLKFPPPNHPWTIGSFYRECAQCLLPVTDPCHFSTSFHFDPITSR